MCRFRARKSASLGNGYPYYLELKIGRGHPRRKLAKAGIDRVDRAAKPGGRGRDDTLDDTLSGKATFGFVSRYKKGATVPTGNTEFVFEAGDLNFHSSSYQRLVVTGSDYARFKGLGTINGEGDYRCMLWAGDGEPDTFRIRIWEEDERGTEADIYDNGFDQEIGGGSIVIHTKK